MARVELTGIAIGEVTTESPRPSLSPHSHDHILATGMGLVAPLFGVGYYATCGIGRVDPAEGIKPIWGYVLALLVGLIIVSIFPWNSIGFL